MQQHVIPTDLTERAEIRNLIRDLRDDCRDKHFSDVIDAQGLQYVDLVMEGGGTLGIALVGYTYVLEELGMRFLRIGGTSAGSINALLIASLGTPSERKSEAIAKLLAQMPIDKFLDGDADARDFIRSVIRGSGKYKLMFKGFQILDAVEERLGLNPGEAFYHWLAGVLAASGIETTKSLRERMHTLPEGLRRRDDKDLTVDQKSPLLAIVAADISTETRVELPKMSPLYWKDPEEVNPALFVRASMSIPFFFHPFRIRDLPSGQAAWDAWRELANYEEDLPDECTLVDGGVMSNFPIDLFHRRERIPAAPTFGVKLGSNQRRKNRINKPFDLVTATINSARHCLDFDFIARNPDYKKLVTCIDTGDHHWLDFSPSADRTQDLFNRGARAACNFLRRFDWDKYKLMRTHMAEALAADARTLG